MIRLININNNDRDSLSGTFFKWSFRIFIFLFLNLLQATIILLAQTTAPSPNENFVRTEAIRVQGITTDAGVINLTSDQKIMSYQYFDGIGKELQNVSWQASPAKKDIILPSYYDSKGNPVRGYLPYQASTTNGSFKTSATTEQASFYNTPPAGVPLDSRAYTTNTFESSPLNRLLSTTKPGIDFSTKTITAKIKVNDASSIRIWTISSGLPRSTTTYPAASLTIQENKDEAGFINRTYSDFSGKTILTQVQATTTTWLNTYYVYNDYNELLFIIPPEASANYTPDQAYADLWYTRFEYDNLGREIGTKAPGAGWIYTIYDRWDRPVLVQDGVQRAKTTPEWTYFKYDSFNRLAVTGTLATTSTRASLTTAVANATTRDELRNTSTVGYSLNRTYPTTANEASIIGIIYYDDYGFLSIANWAPNNSLYNYVAESGFTGTKISTTKGLVTGGKSKTQGENSSWLHSVTYYDQYYQPLQVISSHQNDGTIKTVNQYAFSGEITKSVNIYSYKSNNITNTTRIQRRYTYDHAGRPLKLYHQLNSLAEVMLSEITYNELGQAYRSKHHSRNNGSTFMYQSITDFTIQGWQKKNQYQFSNGSNVFTQELAYQNAMGSGNAGRFDGLITASRWKHGTTAAEEVYNYGYDTPKRLTQSTFLQKNNGSTSWTTNNFYNENGIQYDKNGNIKNLVRNQPINNTATQIDNISYAYSGNRLTSVTDNAPTASKALGFNDGNASGTDYTYNEDGDLKIDNNKAITSITYNKLNLPQRIQFSSTGSNIRYTYSASGDLLTITHHNTSTGAATKTIQYVGELIFENGTLRDINHEYGRVLANAGNKYQYYLADHLGSTRVVLQEDPSQFSSSATFETMAMEEESQQFLNYDEATRVAAAVFDHTDSVNSNYSIRLSGNDTGLAKSISVLPGDTVRMQVFAKFIEHKKAKSDPVIMAMLLGVTGAAGLAADGEIAGTISQPSSQTSFAGLLGAKNSDGNSPPAYLNYLFFDREMNYKYGGFVQMSEAASEDGSNVPHEELNQEVIAEEAGYFYIYLSNEGGIGDEAFFDDFTIQVSESFIVQTIDYYPYGMVAKKWLRPGERETKELFQGKTYEDLTKWYDFHARQYDAALGRWFAVDPQFLQFPHLSGYNAMMNNPLLYVDPDGELPFLVFAAAAAIGGGMNLWSNWDNVKDFKSGLAYFTSGAIGGAVSVVNPALGGSITASANVGIDIATGNIPNFQKPTDVFFYAGKKVLDGVGVGGSGQLAKLGYKTMLGWGWFQQFRTPADLALTRIGEAGTSMAYEMAEITLEASKKPFQEIAVSVTKNVIDDAARGAVQYSDDLVRAAQQTYPKLAGKTQLHHITPKYLGGAKNGPLVPLDGAYHQMITNEFRALWGYGKGVPSATELQSIMKQVYSKYPLPPGYGF